MRTDPVALTQQQIERKLAQHSNDIESIYEMLGDIQSNTAAIRHHLGEHDARFDAQDARFDAIEAKIDAHDARFDAQDARFDAIEAKIDAHDARFDQVDASLAEVLRRLPEHRGV